MLKDNRTGIGNYMPFFICSDDNVTGTKDMNRPQCDEEENQMQRQNQYTNTTLRSGIYHEKQIKELCALHALNNLFQDPNTFKKADLDKICQDLSPDSWINPHRSALGLGNYDVNIIMAALQWKGYEAVWFDKRRDPETLCLDQVFGFILNVPSDFRFRFVVVSLGRRHWIAVRRVAGAYYNLDSKLDSPHVIGQGAELVGFLREQIQCKEKELFIVISKQTERSQLWLNNNSEVTTAATSECNNNRRNDNENCNNSDNKVVNSDSDLFTNINR